MEEEEFLHTHKKEIRNQQRYPSRRIQTFISISKQRNSNMIRTTVVALLLASTNAFQFMSNFKITPPADVEREAQTKAKFGNKSELRSVFER